MKHIQVTLTVEEGKEIISLGMLKHPLLISAMENNRILFKGGTTVSKITEKLAGIPLKICGRITQRGTVAGKHNVDGAHSIIYYKGEWKNVDETIEDDILKFTENDLIVCGANSFDNYGNAAIMTGGPGGDIVGRAMSAWYTEGAKVIIPVGIEKMVPGNLRQIIGKTGRKIKSLSWGMAVGLLPVMGEIFTEIDAIKMLAAVDCFAIGAGGLKEAQGSTTLDIIAPSDDEYEKIVGILKDIKTKKVEVSGIKESLDECEAICVNCSKHLGCGYKSKNL